MSNTIRIGLDLYLKVHDGGFLLTRAPSPDHGSVGIEMSKEEAGHLASILIVLLGAPAPEPRVGILNPDRPCPDWSAT